MKEEHWCIKKDCRHGTLNGSLQLGHFYLREFNSGYASGRKDTGSDFKLLHWRDFPAHFVKGEVEWSGRCDYCNLIETINTQFREYITQK